MKSLKNFVLLLIMLSSTYLSAQKLDNFIVSINYGTKGLTAELSEVWPIRQDVGSYYDGFNSNVNLGSWLNYAGVSPEFSFFNKKLSISPGLRFTNLNAEIVKSDYYKEGYYFLRVNSDGITTNYARVKAIREETNYLGVPLEVKFTPFYFSYISFHVKLSAELAYKIYSSTDIEFKHADMENYQNEVLNDLSIGVNNVYSSVYASMGARFSLGDKMFCSLDVFLPAFYMTKNNSSLVNINNISGAQFSLDIPI